MSRAGVSGDLRGDVRVRGGEDGGWEWKALWAQILCSSRRPEVGVLSSTARVIGLRLVLQARRLVHPVLRLPELPLHPERPASPKDILLM